MELLAEDCKKQGNDCMTKEKYYEAVFHYTKGIKIDPYNPHLYSNRSAAFFKIQQYYHSLDDAKKVIEMLPKWPKGYYRKGEIEMATEHYEEAVHTYKQGLQHTRNDPDLLKCLQGAQRLLIAQQKHESRYPMFGLALGALVGFLLVISDELISNQPMFKNDILRVVIVIIIVCICVGFSLLYRYFLRSQRQSLLEAPPDLLGDADISSLLGLSTREPNGTDQSKINKGSSTNEKKKNL